MFPRASIPFAFSLACCGLDLLAGDSLPLSGLVSSGVDSAYLSSSGSLCDTHPVCWQEADWLWSLGPWGYLTGYGWFQNALNDCKNDERRMLMNEFEGTCCYNFDFSPVPLCTVKTKAGVMWNPELGYVNGNRRNYGPWLVQSLENPYVTPFHNTLLLFAPGERVRIRLGLMKDLPFCESFTLAPKGEFVWSNAQRYRRKFGEDPDAPFLGGAFDAFVGTLALSRRLTESLSVTICLRQFAMLGAQARDITRRRAGETARTELTVFGVSLRYAF